MNHFARSFRVSRISTALTRRIVRLCTTTVAVTLTWSAVAEAAARSDMFHDGLQAYRGGDYVAAAESWSKNAELQPASGTLQNLGLAEWQRGRRAPAILAWEQAIWVDPFNAAVRENLQFARKAALLEAPEYSWCEAASMWLPANAWALLAGTSLWCAVALIMLPRLLRWRRTGWHQALAAAGFAVFLVCLPSLYGVHTRTQIGIVLAKETPLRLTPTREAQTILLLSEGQPVRCERTRGTYWLVRTSSGNGWVERAQVGRICPE
jgi:hypothetical protein